MSININYLKKNSSDYSSNLVLFSNEKFNISNLKKLRAQIDLVDNTILEPLGKRMLIAENIGQLKKSKNVAVLQTKRWNEILGKMVLEGKKHNLSEEFILKLFKAIHQESINHQKQILKK